MHVHCGDHICMLGFAMIRESVVHPFNTYYRQISNIRRTKSQHLKDSHTVLRLSLENPLKPDIKSITKM